MTNKRVLLEQREFKHNFSLRKIKYLVPLLTKLLDFHVQSISPCKCCICIITCFISDTWLSPNRNNIKTTLMNADRIYQNVNQHSPYSTSTDYESILIN